MHSAEPHHWLSRNSSKIRASLSWVCTLRKKSQTQRVRSVEYFYNDGSGIERLEKHYVLTATFTAAFPRLSRMNPYGLSVIQLLISLSMSAAKPPRELAVFINYSTLCMHLLKAEENAGARLRRVECRRKRRIQEAICLRASQVYTVAV